MILAITYYYTQLPISSIKLVETFTSKPSNYIYQKSNQYSKIISILLDSFNPLDSLDAIEKKAIK